MHLFIHAGILLVESRYQDYPKTRGKAQEESSLDCIPHTRDDPELNDRCLRFSEALQKEIAYFPGMGYRVLETADLFSLEYGIPRDARTQEKWNLRGRFF